MLPRRLDKFVRQCTRLNLSRVRKLLADGKIDCQRLGPSGRPFDPSALVFEEDEVLLEGQLLQPKTKQAHYLLNKPRGVTSTVRDPRGKRDLSEWMRHMAPGTFPVGRLDRETTGALLFSTDGNLASALMRPDHETHKTYFLWVRDELDDDDPRLSSWTKGVPSGDSLLQARRVEVLRRSEDRTQVQVTLSEGKNRQIRRMCCATGLRLIHLHRDSIGPLQMNGLETGQLRRLSEDDEQNLWRALGGRESVERKQLSALVRQAEMWRAAGTPHERLEHWLAADQRG